MGEKRNSLVDVTRVVAAVGVILSHVDMSCCGVIGEFLGQFLLTRCTIVFFLAIIGFYVEKSYQAGKKPILKRVCSLTRVYGAWSLVYLALSFVMLVLIQKMPIGQYLLSRVKDFLFTGSYYHFWFYPAVIYALLFIGGVKKLLGNQALKFLLPLAVALYIVGLLGTGYLPIGRQIPGLRALYASEYFDPLMHLTCLGFPSVVFGMAAAHENRKRSGRMLLIATAVYAAESVMLCLILGWRENPQMLIGTPFMTVLFLQWLQNSSFTVSNVNPMLLRTVSASMYNVHPLLLAAFALVVPELKGLWAFLACTAFSAFFGWVLYRLRNNRFFALFI